MGLVEACNVIIADGKSYEVAKAFVQNNYFPLILLFAFPILGFIFIGLITKTTGKANFWYLLATTILFLFIGVGAFVTTLVT